ncbi:MAG: gliding motility-associated C-terminal domain-containing protein, partial [Bacteroidetes bacterium]|nr:gliding motility-associated C-terminal domain-containing protein [Bacteroidota bacterium]
SGNGFVINVFQCQEGYRLCSYNPGFNTEKLDIEMRINNSSHLDWGKDSIPRFCNGNIKFECFTNYKVDSWKWIIEDSNYNKNGFFHKFKDTGKHRVIMIANRISPVITCNGTYVLSDTIIRDIWVYSSPIIEIFEDTIVACIGEKIILKNIRKGDNKPQWLFDIGKLSCTYCGEPEFIAQENSPKLQTIGVMISKNGCLPARDTVTIIRKEPLRLRISGDSLICYGEEILLTAKASGGDSSGYKILWPEYGLRDSVITKLYESKKILAILEDGCSYNNGQLYRDTVEFKVMVSNRFKLIEINDTSVCKSSDLNVLLKTTGGNNSAYKTFWLNGIVLPDSLLKINSNISQKYQIIAGESCSPVRDTSYFTVNIKPDPNVTLISDTFVCKTSSHILKFKVQGDTIQKFNLLHNFNTLVLNDSNKSEYNFIWKIGNKNERFLALLSNKCSNTFDSLNVNLLIKNQLKFNTEVVYDTICKSSDTIKLKLIYNNLQLHQFKLYDSQHVNLIDSNSTGLFVISCKEGNNHFIATVDDGCNVGDTIKITLVNLKPLKTVFNYTPSCFIDTLHLKVALSDGNIKRYKVGWYNMSNYQIGNENIYKYAGKNSIDTIILRVEDGCSPSFSEIIPIKPMTKSKISVNSISQCLISNQFDFGNNSSKVKGTETNYYWNYDTNLNVTIKNTNLLRGSYTGTGLHNVKLIAVTDSFCNDTSNINVNIIANPNLSIKWIRTTNTEDSSIFRFNAISDQPLTSYRWEIDKFPAQFEDTIFQKFNYRGNVRVKVFGTNSYGCIGDTFIEFEVMHRMHFYLPNIITPNGDGINDAFYFPGKEYVKEYSISIFNRWGEKLFYSTNPNELFSPDDKSNNLYIYLINVLDIYNERQLINGSFSVIQ